MKAETYRQIKTLVPISADGMLGAIVETYSNPEGYSIDLAIPDSRLVGGFRYHNVILTREQFIVMENKSNLSKQEKIKRFFDTADKLQQFNQVEYISEEEIQA